MIKKINLLVIIVLILLSCSHNKEILYYSAFTILPETERNMNTPGFWIGLLKEPDKIILTQDEISEYNSLLDEDFDSIKNSPEYGTIYSGNTLVALFKESFDTISSKELYLANGEKPDSSFYENIINNMNLNRIPETINIKHGFIIHYSNQRVLPIEELLNTTQGELLFDTLQMSALDIGTPVIILHKSLDNKWIYVFSPLTEGWIKSENISTCSLENMKEYLGKKSFSIITSAKGEIFLNPELTEYYDYCRMGAKLVSIYSENIDISNNDNSEYVKVLLPDFTDNNNPLYGYLKKEQINTSGYIPYTQRNIINQAFKLLNTPYGWGGMFGEQDCSRFICEIFATTGIRLPRNSSWQANAGEIVFEFNNTMISEKLENINEYAIPGISILKMPGHIMLYLGVYNNKVYAIHTLWAYKERIKFKEIIRMVNRTTVSDLSLGIGTKAGSFLQKLTKIVNIRLY